MPHFSTNPFKRYYLEHLPLCLPLCLFLAGCATTHVAIKENVSFAKYKRVYLQDFEDDPRHVLPKTTEHLKQLGFEVLLTEKDEPVGGRQGTGFIISAGGLVVTSAHVIGKKQQATIWVDGKRYEADVVRVGVDPTADDNSAKTNRKLQPIGEAIKASLNSRANRPIDAQLNDKDFALLKITSPDQSFLPASFASQLEYQMGQDVYTIGFPLSNLLGDKPRLNKGLISSTVGMRDNPNFLQISAEIQPGNSGGPLLNAKGQVVGMVQMTVDPATVYSQTGAIPQNINFAVKAAMLREFLTADQDKARPLLRENDVVPFDQVQHSVVQIRSGIIPEGFKEEPKLACVISYSYIWDMFYRFQLLDVVLYDVDTQEVLLRAGQYGDNPLKTENMTLDDVFKEVKRKIGR